MGKKIEYDFLINNKQAISSIKKINSELDKTEKKLKSMKGGPIGGSQKGMGKKGFNFSNMVVPTAALASITALGVRSIQTAAKVQALDNAIIFAGGVRGQSNLKFLNETINSLGLESVSAKQGFKIWTAAIKGTNLEGTKGRKIFESFAKSTKRLGLSADDTSGVFLALGQMVSKGKVSMEELRQQLGERMPGAFQAAARAMGVTTAELDKLVSSGNVTADQLLPKMAAEMEKTFGGDMEKNITGSINRISNVWTEAMSRMGKALSPLAEGIAGLGEDILGLDKQSVLEKNVERAKKLSEKLQRIQALGPDAQHFLLKRLQKDYGDLLPNINAISDKESDRAKQFNDLLFQSGEIINVEKEKLRILKAQEEVDSKRLSLRRAMRSIEDIESRSPALRGKSIAELTRIASQQGTTESVVHELLNAKKVMEKIDRSLIKKEEDSILKREAALEKKQKDLDKRIGVDFTKTTDTKPTGDTPSTLLRNEVRGVSGQVKNITVTVDAVNKIAGNQVINGVEDAEQAGIMFEELMARVTADISQK